MPSPIDQYLKGTNNYRMDLFAVAQTSQVLYQSNQAKSG